MILEKRYYKLLQDYRFSFYNFLEFVICSIFIYIYMYYLLIILIYNYTTECINEIIYYSEVVILLSLSKSIHVYHVLSILYLSFNVSNKFSLIK